MSSLLKTTLVREAQSQRRLAARPRQSATVQRRLQHRRRRLQDRHPPCPASYSGQEGFQLRSAVVASVAFCVSQRSSSTQGGCHSVIHGCENVRGGFRDPSYRLQTNQQHPLGNLSKSPGGKRRYYRNVLCHSPSFLVRPSPNPGESPTRGRAGACCLRNC